MKVAVLGPKGTYSEIACIKYLEEKNLNYEMVYYNSIDEAVHSLNSECDFAIVPIENTLDGYVQKTLDLLLEDNITVIDQLSIKVSFKLVSNEKIEQVRKIYAQFKAINQCVNFINKIPNVKIINTESNIISYELWNESKKFSASIVPTHLKTNAIYEIDDITDSNNNYTRFFVLSKNSKMEEYDDLMRIPLYIIPLTEHPGLLYEILKVFNDYKINLTSILSRPKKIIMGEYNFYLEIEATKQQLYNFLHHVDSTNTKFKIKILGKLKENNNG